jgi:hypothetical protein
MGRIRAGRGLFYYRLLPSGNIQQFESIEKDLVKRGIRAERRKLATGGTCYRFAVGIGHEPILNVSPLEAFSMYPSDWDVSTGLTGGRWERVKSVKG